MTFSAVSHATTLFIRTLLLLLLCAPQVKAVESFAPVVDDALPAVVNISTTQEVSGFSMRELPGIPGLRDDREQELRDFLERFGFPLGDGDKSKREVNSLGSGFVIDAEGYVVTNNHVIAEASEIVVTFADDRKLEAEVVGRDPKTDLALLKVESEKPLDYVEFGDSTDMRIGDWVIAIGNPFGLGSTVTSGIISARSRNINAGPYDDFLQTDAAINRGNSGGPMFNTDGEVIGVNTAIFSPSGGSVGISFAIPSSLAKPVLDQLREFGRPHRGWLGVKIQKVTKEIAASLGLDEPRGALVLEITPDSPADKAGIQPGDVIVEFEGNEVETMRKLPRMVAETPVGERVALEVWRNNETQEITLTLGEFPEQDAQTNRRGKDSDTPEQGGKLLLGMYLRPLTEELKDQLDIAGVQKGVVITGVKEGSEAAQRALRPGFVIVAVNQTSVTSVRQFEKALEEARNADRDYILVRVLHEGSSSYVTLPLD